MYFNFFNNREKIASEFVARLHSGELTTDDEKSFEMWLLEDPRNKIEYEKHLQVWSLSEDLREDCEFINEVSDYSAVNKASRNFMKIAVSIFFIGSIFMMTNYFWINKGQNVYSTMIGKQKTISLDDGSVVTMNTNTRILVDMSSDERFVKLEYGEAFFNVARDESRPFVVEAGERAVRVLGTSFNVLLDAERTKVGVIEGLVAVHESGEEILDFEAIVSSESNDKAITLEAGNLLTFQNMASIEPVKEQLEDISRLDEWRKQIITFDEQSMLEVLKELNRYSSRKILVEDREVVDLKVSGVFPLTDIESILEGMEHSFPVNIIRYTDRIVIVGKKSS